VAQLRKIETIAAMRIKHYGLLFMQKPIRKCFLSRQPMAHCAGMNNRGLLISFTRDIDTMVQIRLFGKLKLRSCARAGNRAGLFCFCRAFSFLMTRLD
jgi:hypothetical protein